MIVGKCACFLNDKRHVIRFFKDGFSIEMTTNTTIEICNLYFVFTFFSTLFFINCFDLWNKICA